MGRGSLTRQQMITGLLNYIHLSIPGLLEDQLSSLFRGRGVFNFPGVSSAHLCAQGHFAFYIIYGGAEASVAQGCP